MASVYLCEDLKHDRKVALKLLKPELAAVLGAERFLLLEGPPPMRAAHLNVITNFPRYVEEKLRGAKPE